MGKNIILLSDGTGNSAAKRHKTNVWRLYDALDLHRSDQIAYYDDGVGSQSFLPFKLLGGAFGWGLKRNVRELYKFLCRNYEKGDRIYLFGFSRGAFTVRMLASMVVHCGVCRNDRGEEGLDDAAKANYNAFRSRFKAGLLTRALRIFLGRNKCVEARHHPEIEFIGVWDTVDAYGLPIDELSRLWHWLVYPIYFPDHKLSSKVKKACHAVAVDDERKTFHPVLWDEGDESDADRIEQVWFPGVHSDVGGGYPRYTLALVSLDWMLTKAEAQDSGSGSPGLHMIAERRREYAQHADWHGPQHDSRSMAGSYYRYSPRDMEKLCNDARNGVSIRRPRIHRSVFERIAGNAVPYAPTGLPEDYVVDAPRNPSEEYEPIDQRRLRRRAMHTVDSTIAGRKCLYYAFLLVSLVFVLTPLPSPAFLPFEVPFMLGCTGVDQCLGESGPLDGLLQMAMKLLPDFTAPWIKVLRAYPNIFYALIGIFGILAWLKARLLKRTEGIATNAWSALKERDKQAGS